MKLSELVDVGYKYVARDADGDLYAYLAKPEKRGDVWSSFGVHHLINEVELDFIKWEDNQPYEITEVIEQVESYKLKTVDTLTTDEEKLLPLLEKYLELDYSFKITPKLIKTIFGRYIVEYRVEIQKIMKDEV